MHYYKTIIQYQGTNYAGFQWQNGPITIQSEFNLALSKIINKKFTTVAASRTDTGVHAFHQVVKISTEENISLSAFIQDMNSHLPLDIKCISIEECDGLFRPSANTTSKEYRYFFTNKINESKDDSRFIANIANPLNLSLIKECVKALIGSHDFCNFYSSGSNVSSTIRVISVCELSIVNPHEILSTSELFNVSKDISNCYELKIEANGFLKQMIRHIVSALWLVGSGKLSKEEFLFLLDGPKNGPKSNKQRWKVAPANGLILYRINY